MAVEGKPSPIVKKAAANDLYLSGVPTESEASCAKMPQHAPTCGGKDKRAPLRLRRSRCGIWAKKEESIQKNLQAAGQRKLQSGVAIDHRLVTKDGNVGSRRAKKEAAE